MKIPTSLPRIIVHTAGTHFGCYATVRVGRKVIHTTRLFPFGFNGAAQKAASDWLAVSISMRAA